MPTREIAACVNAEITAFQPSQAEDLVTTFRAVYGDDYPVARIYEPDYWIEQNQSDELFTYVAQLPGGKVAGLLSFYRVAPFSGLYEFGRLAVAPEHQKKGLGLELLTQALEKFSVQPVVSGIYAEMSCHWKVSQKMIHQLSFQDTALQIGLLGPVQSQRFSAVVSYFDVRDRSQVTYLPPRWKELLLFCYDELGLRRRFEHQGPPLHGTTQLSSILLPGPALARLDFQAAGEDFEDQVTAAEAKFRSRGAEVIQLRLNLEDPRTLAAAELAHGLGYHCCGLLPRWFDGDGLLLQKNLQSFEFGHDQIASQRAQEMARRIEFQWK